MLKGKLKFIIAIGAIAFAVAYLVYGGVRETMVYYLTVEELHARVPDVYGERVRVSGNVIPGTIKHGADGALEFSVVEGVYSESGVFQADILLAKCPTKYESTDVLYNDQGAPQGTSY